ncbi:hypothetical protein Q5M48_02970 [Acinetobacter nosocomialis]|uniref:hypothetical protein n=1 Tax=Acinetobacter nosocomialis TaxID=106654 RepID=UPI0026ECFECE|nr:hypothetical protein [Acinetobacter nosocomialis]MDO7207147.1 hypothetical protein [Acinetobacter nosocomialis]
MFELISINRKSKLREIRIIKAFLIFAFVLCLLILYIEYQKYAHINWKFIFIASMCVIYDSDLNKKIKELKVQIKSD